MAIDINIPSQVKNYANLAAFPATGSLKTIFIAEDTNKTYRWTGSAYVEISATAASTWGTITGTLSNQTDLQTALNAKVTGNTAITGATKTKVTYDSKGLVTAGADATTADIADSTNKRYVTDANLTVIGNTSGTNTGDQTLSGLGGVPTTRTLTINGTTQDLSADRTFTVSTGITIGTTAITSGTVGRVLFEGTGNVVQESANLFWDNTNGRLGIGTSTPNAPIHILYNPASQNGINIDGTANSLNHIAFSRSGIVYGRLGVNASSGEFRWDCGAASSGYFPTIYTNGSERFRIVASTGNVLINTTTDAGFKLDVNGTARVSGLITAGGGLTWGSSPSDSSLSNGAAGTNAINISRRGISLSNGADNGILLDGGNGASSISRIYIGGGSGTQPLCLNGNARETVFGSDTATSNASSLVRMVSTTKGFLPPVMTTTQKNAIASPSAGLMVYDTTLNLISVYNGTTWISL